jgi:hypothetical protein
MLITTQDATSQDDTTQAATRARGARDAATEEAATRGAAKRGSSPTHEVIVGGIAMCYAVLNDFITVDGRVGSARECQ